MFLIVFSNKRYLKIIVLTCYIFIYSFAYAENDKIKLREIYNKDLSFSKKAIDFQGKSVRIYGFMALPLKAESRFFVLTKMPMSVCPFCESDADWPDDIVVVYTEEILRAVPFNVPIIVEGILDLGSYKDEESGFYSRVRLLKSEFEKYN